MGISKPTFTSHENGTRAFYEEDAERYGRALGVHPVWLLTGHGAPSRRFSVPVLGYVGAGAEVISIDDHAPGAAQERVDLPFGDTMEIVALRVQGDSMYPAYRDNDLLFYDREPLPPRECLGRECVIRLVDGHTYIKLLTKGGQPGRYTLISYNAPPLEDMEVEWAVPVRWVERR